MCDMQDAELPASGSPRSERAAAHGAGVNGSGVLSGGRTPAAPLSPGSGRHNCTSPQEEILNTLGSDSEGEIPAPSGNIAIALFTSNLVIGLVLGQLVFARLSTYAHSIYIEIVQIFTDVCLAYIMITIGAEFYVDKSKLREFLGDYVVAFGASAVPWTCVALWFGLALPKGLPWQTCVLAAKFAAPTSAGILFSMLEGAGLKETWLFQKARILAICDDLDTILILVPLTLATGDISWEPPVTVALMVLLLIYGWHRLHQVKLPCTWRWLLAYSVVVVGITELVYIRTRNRVSITVLLPGFVLGCVMQTPHSEHTASLFREKDSPTTTSSPRRHRAGTSQRSSPPASPQKGVASQRSASVQSMTSGQQVSVPGTEEMVDEEELERVTAWVSAAFMVLVGLMVPPVWVPNEDDGVVPLNGSDAGSFNSEAESGSGPEEILMSTEETVWHVFCVTLLMFVGKFFVICCYTKDTNLWGRLALALSLCPRGELAAGLILISIEHRGDYGIPKSVVTVTILALIVNMMLTGPMVALIRRLVLYVMAQEAAEDAAEARALEEHAFRVEAAAAAAGVTPGAAPDHIRPIGGRPSSPTGVVGLRRAGHSMHSVNHLYPLHGHAHHHAPVGTVGAGLRHGSVANLARMSMRQIDHLGGSFRRWSGPHLSGASSPRKSHREAAAPRHADGAGAPSEECGPAGGGRHAPQLSAANMSVASLQLPPSPKPAGAGTSTAAAGPAHEEAVAGTGRPPRCSPPAAPVPGPPTPTAAPQQSSPKAGQMSPASAPHHAEPPASGLSAASAPQHTSVRPPPGSPRSSPRSRSASPKGVPLPPACASPLVGSPHTATHRPSFSAAGTTAGRPGSVPSTPLQPGEGWIKKVGFADDPSSRSDAALEHVDPQESRPRYPLKGALRHRSSTST
eukprot:TRINITY_DN22403_c0_g1_i1.p1 TRINITY_DN22403_c0_g1~~TRINITY_DN22403_c0_g1_i1.p1  ORF type:complete len:911 (+),score=112.48 TRINITY_DN22403_c0_g1_i1:67-2799(+)